MVSILVDGLRHSYGAFEALRGVSFQVAPGEICGYLGPNGAGKSTTMKVLTGTLRPSAGSIQIMGHDLAADPTAAKRALGYVPEGAAMYPLLSPLEHVELICDLHDLDVDAAVERAIAVLTSLDAAKVFERRTDSLSKGQRRKAAIACAVVHEPRVLLLDEPLSGLDVMAVRAFKDMLAELAGRGVAVLYSSHNLEVVARVCERVIILASGAVAAEGPVASLTAMGSSLADVFAELAAATPEAALLAELDPHQ